MRYGGDGVVPVDEQVPEGLGGVGAGEPAGHPDDGRSGGGTNGGGGVGPGRVHRGRSSGAWLGALHGFRIGRPRTGRHGQKVTGESDHRAVVADDRRRQRHTEGLLQCRQHLHGLERRPSEAPERRVRPDRIGGPGQDPRPHLPHDLDGLRPSPGRLRERFRRRWCGIRPTGYGSREPTAVTRRDLTGPRLTRSRLTRFWLTCPPLTRCEGTLLETLPQPPALQLATRRTGERPRRQGQHPHIVMEQRLAHPGRDAFEHLRRIARGPCPGDEHHDALRTGDRVGRTNHRRGAGRQPGCRGRDLFHVRGVEGAAVEEQHVLVPARDAQPAVPQEPEVTGAEPALGEHLRADVGKAVVATGQLGAAHHDVPGPPVPEDGARVVDDAHGAAGHRQPHIHQLDGRFARFGIHRHSTAQRRPVQDQGLGHLPGRREGHRQRRLRQAVDRLGRRGIQPRGPDLVGEGTPHRGRDRLRPDQDQPYGREVQPGQGLVGNTAYGQRQGEVGRGQHRGTMPGRHLEPQTGPLGERQRTDLDLPGPGGQRSEMRADEPHVVEVRHPADHHVVGAQRRCGPYLLQIGQHRAVRHLHPLGRTGASRGELHERDVVTPRGGRLPQCRSLPQDIEGQGANGVGEFTGQRSGRGVHDDGRPPQVLPDREHPTGVRRQWNRNETGRHRTPEHRLELLAAVGEQRHAGPGRHPRLPEASGHAQGIVQELAQADRQLAAVAADMHDDLPGSLTDRVQQYIQQCHVVFHRSVGPFLGE